MNNKPVAVVRHNPSIKEKVDKIQSVYKTVADKTDFLQRRIDEIRNHAITDSISLWTDLERECQSQGLLPAEYSSANCHLHYNPEDDLLFTCSGCGPNSKS